MYPFHYFLYPILPWRSTALSRIYRHKLAFRYGRRSKHAEDTIETASSMCTPTCAASECVAASIRWLDYASATLNPDRLPEHAVHLGELLALLRSAQSPPSTLQDEWSAQVWAMAGEPYLVYLLRCLAHQSGLTQLSPHFVVPTTEIGNDDGVAVAAVTAGNSANHPSRLFWERCVVVGVRVEPTTKNLLQTGWETQPCPHCVVREGAAADAHDGPSRRQRLCVLPLLYGGTQCGECGHALPLVPTWTRALYLVLQRRDRSRAAAVAYGEEVHRHLWLGVAIDALLYTSATEKQQQLLVVHAAAAPARAAPSATLSCAETTKGALHIFCQDEHVSRLALKWGDGTAFYAAANLHDVARRVAPQLQGQAHIKELLLLVVLYIVYHASHPEAAGSHRHPLHVLLVGPAKTGKSALLREVAQLIGLEAEVLEATVVRTGGSGGAAGGSSFSAALPMRRSAVLMAGSGMTASTLVLDQLPSTAAGAAAMAPLLEAMERGHGCGAAGGEGEGAAAGGPDVHQLPSTIIAAAGEESAAAVQLAPYFSLIAAVAPTNSLDDTAIISQDVVAASRARSSHSRATSRSMSRATQLSASSPHHSQSGPSVSQSTSRRIDPSALSERLTHDDVRYFVRRAAEPALLSSVVSHAACYDAFIGKLVDCAGLLEEAQPSVCHALPPPSACRGQHRIGHPSAASDSLRAAPLAIDEHLRILCALSRARVLLERAELLRDAGWTAQMRDEVWALYHGHLVAFADLIQRRSCGSGAMASRDPAEVLRMTSWQSSFFDACGGSTAAPAPAGYPPPSRFSGDAAALGREWKGGMCAMSSREGRGLWHPQKTPSKKRCRLMFVDALRQRQRLSAPVEGAVPPSEVEHLFGLLGGSSAFGDPLDVVISQMQEEGLLLRRPGGWRSL
ncbi:hypothetical protein, conserved [Leishmania donovani]|uniref:MCM2/3/5 family, putative n=1 Tax=Leishmania donovani TaxID=5661 RepID=E9BU14_LEIDO|nr:hypothetical protein, conserved [Leishmania donovani]AYU83655.1 MCM2/3/5 family, putative [Leishmania donovani]CBZ38743.1 hypothetical protein, conserved [Leishmania donovani]